MGIWSKLGAFANVIVPGLLTKTRLVKEQTVARLKPAVEKSLFGRLPGGTIVESYLLHNGRGSAAKLADVVLGLENLRAYLAPHPFFGGTIRTVRQPHCQRPLLS